MHNFHFLDKGLGIVSPAHFVYGFSTKMFLLYSVKAIWKSRHRHRHWHQDLHRHRENFSFSLGENFFQKIEHLCPNILRWA